MLGISSKHIQSKVQSKKLKLTTDDTRAKGSKWRYMVPLP